MFWRTSPQEKDRGAGRKYACRLRLRQYLERPKTASSRRDSLSYFADIQRYTAIAAKNTAKRR